MKRILVCLSIFALFVGVYTYLYLRWSHLWEQESPVEHYTINRMSDDTVRVAMIGDSWAGMHHGASMEKYIENHLSQNLRRPVKCLSDGKGGAKTKEIYNLLFSEKEIGFKRLLSGGADYCIISAGINDAAANLGTEQYLYYYGLILDFLSKNGIRSIVLEVPDVEIWNIYGEKPLKELFVDFLKSTMTHCGMYHFPEYREALIEMLNTKEWEGKYLYIPMSEWNKTGSEINEILFLPDKIHLNRRGYERMDSCIVNAICRDVIRRAD